VPLWKKLSVCFVSLSNCALFPAVLTSASSLRQLPIGAQPLPVQDRGRNAALDGLGVISDNLLNIGRVMSRRAAP
jgi:hypothetical protein